jgi:hypothetical protein
MTKFDWFVSCVWGGIVLFISLAVGGKFDKSSSQ